MTVGRDSEEIDLSTEAFARFAERLQQSLAVLDELLEQPGFGSGTATLGAEVEMALVDERADPLYDNERVQAAAADPRVSLELNRFNLELNTAPVLFAPDGLAELREEMEGGLGRVARAAASCGGRALLVGILPTLCASHLGSHALTDRPRYRALAFGLRRLRGGRFRISIRGDDALDLESDDVSLEGANSALQVHLRVAPEDFARMYNAGQLATVLALGVCGNSPLLLGKALWEETRVALFKHAVDDRDRASWPDASRPSPRVSFGHGWARRGAAELFRENVALYRPLLPILGEEAPREALAEGRVPLLEELRLHNSTVWRWNRPVYDPADGGHLRLELRALPAGPTVADMTANAALLIGLTLALAPDIERMLAGLPFEHARWSFYRAARSGLQAELLWPSERAPSPVLVPLHELLAQLLPAARDALVDAGLEPADVDAALQTIEHRLSSGQTGARWQRFALREIARNHPPDEALRLLVERYHACSSSGVPVSRWPLPS